VFKLVAHIFFSFQSLILNKLIGIARIRETFLHKGVFLGRRRRPFKGIELRPFKDC
jgi:hypothetical protein